MSNFAFGLWSDYPQMLNKINKMLRPLGARLRSKTNREEWGDQVKVTVERVWISVDKELPAPNDRVLVCHDTACIENAVDIGYLSHGVWCSDSLDRRFVIVHHWMPLPLLD